MIDCMRIMLTFYKLSMSIVVAYTFGTHLFNFHINFSLAYAVSTKHINNQL